MYENENVPSAFVFPVIGSSQPPNRLAEQISYSQLLRGPTAVALPLNVTSLPAASVVTDAARMASTAQTREALMVMFNLVVVNG